MAVDLIIKAKVDGNAKQELNDLKNAGEQTARSTDGLSSSFSRLSGVLAGVGFLALTKQAVDMADTYKLMEARLALVSKSTSELVSTQSELFQMAQNSRSSLEATTGLYTKLAMATESMGKSQKEVLAVTEAVGKALKISGAGASESASAMLQLGQALASGTLRGDELNSILENAPRLAKAIAEGMGVSIGQLRTLGADGKLVAQDVFNAIEKSGSKLDEEFKRIPVTVGDSVEQIKNSLLELVGTTDKTINGSGGLAEVFTSLSSSISENKVEIIEFGRDFLRSLQLMGAGAVGIATGFMGVVDGIAGGIAKELQFVLNTLIAHINGVLSLAETATNKVRGLFGGNAVKLGRVDAMSFGDDVLASSAKRFEESANAFKTIGVLTKEIAEFTTVAQKAGNVSDKEGARIAGGIAPTKEQLAAAKKALAEAKKAQEEELKIQKGYLDSYAEMEAKAAITQYETDIGYIDDLAARQANSAIAMYELTRSEADKINEKYLEIFNASGNIFDAETLDNFFQKWNESLDGIQSKMDFSASIEFDPQSMDGMAKAIAGIGKSMSALSKAEEQYRKNKAITGATSEELAKNESDYTKDQIAGYSNMAGAMSSMFKQGSDEAKAMQVVQGALAIVEGARVVMNAGASGDGYTAVIRMAAAAAAVASTLSSFGINNSVGSSGASMAVANSGTVLGDNKAVSESTTNITDLLSSIHVSEYSQLRDINRAVTSMSQNILKAVTNIFKTGVTDTSGISLTSSSYADGVNKRIDKTLELLDKSPLNIGGIMSNAFLLGGSSIIAKVAGFMGSSKQYIAGSGFNIAQGTLGDKADGNVGASTYVDIETMTKKWGRAKYSHNIITTALDSEASQSIALIYRSFSDTMMAINKGLGTDLGNSIAGYAVSAINISTAGLTGDEVVKRLNDTFSALGDTMANDVFGSILTQYQKLGEGMLETAVRVIVEKEVVLQDLANVNKAITGNILGITQSLVDLSGGLTKFSDANSSYFENYFSDAEKSAVYQKNLEASYKSMNITMPTTIAGFRSTVDALDLNTESGRETYVSLMNIADAQKTYMDSLKDLKDTIPKPDMMLGKTNDGTVIFKQIQDDNTTMKLMYADMLRTMKSMLTIQQFGVVVA